MKRIKEFIKVLSEENTGIIAILHLFIGFIKILPYLTCKKAEDVQEWQRRYRVCLKCPIYDAELKRCRPYKGSSRGCGCYVPFSNIIYEECWGRLNYGKAIGWANKDKD